MENTDHTLQRIYESYAERLYSYGMQLCQDKSLVQDALHEVFLDLYRQEDRFEEAADKRAYLFAAFRYKLLRMMKKKPSRCDFDEVAVPPSVGGAEEEMIGLEQARLNEALVREMFSSLTQRQREILFLRLSEHMSFQEIADALSIERQSAQNLFGRAVARMRKVFLEETVKDVR